MAEQRDPWSVLRPSNRPFTEIGIKRMACVRCGNKPSYSSWQICSDQRRHRPLCAQCDYDLQVLVLRWFGHPDTERLLEEYRVFLAREGHFIVSGKP